MPRIQGDKAVGDSFRVLRATQGCPQSEQLLEIHAEALDSEKFHVRIRSLYSSLDSLALELDGWNTISYSGVGMAALGNAIVPALTTGSTLHKVLI
jgi:hypothetical protein